VSVVGNDNIIHIPMVEPSIPRLHLPEGQFHYRNTVTGDGSGGTVQSGVRSTRGQEFLYVIDGIGATCETTDGGEGLYAILPFRGEQEISVETSYRVAGTHNTAHGRRYPYSDLRVPPVFIGATRVQAASATVLYALFNWQTNTNGVDYVLQLWGRYYRKAVFTDPEASERILRGSN